jgi:hypothetical protein
LHHYEILSGTSCEGPWSMQRFEFTLESTSSGWSATIIDWSKTRGDSDDYTPGDEFFFGMSVDPTEAFRQAMFKCGLIK